MVSAQQIRDRLACAAEQGDDHDEPVELMRSELASVAAADLPDGLRIHVIERIDAQGIRHITMEGNLRREGRRLVASIEETGWRKWWPGPLGVDDYHDLVLAAVHVRAVKLGDVAVTDTLNDNIHGVIYDAELPAEGTLRTAYDRTLAIRSEIEPVLPAGLIPLRTRIPRADQQSALLRLGRRVRRLSRRRRHDRPHRSPRRPPHLKGASYRIRGRGIDSLPSIRTQNQAD